MKTKRHDEEKDIRHYLHDIKSSLQSLLVANEMVMEDKMLGRKNDSLLRTMMGDIKKIHETVDVIERDFGGERL